MYATTLDFNSLSTNSTLSMNKLNATSTTIFNNLNALSTNSTLSINNLNATSTTVFNNFNALSTNSTLSIYNLNATSTTIFNNLNSLSTNSTFNGTSISRAEMMSAGSLTIGSTDFNFGGNFYTGGVWTGTNTAGLMMECSDYSEIGIHDGGTRVTSFMQYVGGINQFYIGRDMGWGAIGQINTYGNLHVVSGNVYFNKSDLIFNDIVHDMKIQLYTGYGFGFNGGTLRYNAASDHRFYTGSTTTAIINSAGNLGIGTATPPARLDVYDNSMIVRGTNEGDTAILY
jgi:hypothetical protein